MNISAKFQLYPSYSFRGVDFFNNFRKFSFLVTMTINQIERYRQKVYIWKRTTQQIFLQHFRQNICNEIAINANFHFSHYKSKEI